MFNNREGYDVATKSFQRIALERETRSALPTPEAAFHLNRAPQTLRLWATRQDAPVRPLRVNGRLAWPVAELRRLLQVTEHSDVAAGGQ